MNIEIIAATKDPVDLIGYCAGFCYGKSDTSLKRVQSCFDSGHLSVFEHASFTAEISGISRVCSHQLVRHRLASYTQESQRYTKVDGNDWFVMPPAFEPYKDWYVGCMNYAVAEYEGALSRGILKEDARFILPQAATTRIAMTMNARELFHFLDLRTAKHAQWEIRELAHRLADVVADYDPQWKQLIEMWRADVNTEAVVHGEA